MADLVNLSMHGKKVLKDQVTPYKITLLVLIEEYCKTIGQSQSNNEGEVMSEREEREVMISLLHLVQSADLELRDLFLKLDKVAAEQPLHQSVMDRLETLAEDKSGGALMDIFQMLPETLFNDDTPLLHRNSVLGLFVRRMQLAFDKLSFSQISKLCAKYRTFHAYWLCHRKEQQESGANLADMSLSLLEIAGNLEPQPGSRAEVKKQPTNTALDTGKYSQRQAEFFIARQSSLLQHNESAALAPKKLQQRISDLLRSNPDLAEAHYLSYMNYLRTHEYSAAMESLYHYYDRHQTATNPNRHSVYAKAKSEEDIFSKRLRYAALNLAALHYRFGHWLEALAAVKEAITIAQECNDAVCLQHALSWLQRLGIQGTGNMAYMLDRLVSKATELNLPYLASLGVQASAKHIALATAQPSGMFEFMLRSDIVNCQHSLSELMTVSYAQKAALWQLYGKREMCSLNAQLMLFLNTSDQGVFHNGEAECIALCQLSRLQTDQGEYRAALDILGSTKRRFPIGTEHSHIWQLHEQRLLFFRATHHSDWLAADKAITNMVAFNRLEASYCRCVLLKEKGEAYSAFELVQGLVDKCKDKKDQYQEVPELYARLLLLQGDIYCATGNPTAAGQPLLACVTLCREHHFSYTAAIATLNLAFVEYSLGMPHQALSLIEGVMCLILTHGSLYDHARAQFLWSKCRVAAANREGQTSKQEAMFISIQALADVVDWFKKVEAYHRAKLAVYYLARLYHELGFTSDRNKATHELKQLDQQYPASNPPVINVL